MECINKKFTITDEGNIETYLGIQIYHKPGLMRIPQPSLINCIIETVPDGKENLKSIPILPTVIMTKDLNEKRDKRDGTTDQS